MIKIIRYLGALSFCALVGFSLAEAAQDKKDTKKEEKKAQPKKNSTFTDPKDAGIDYVLQGEYIGKIQGGDKLAAQVIALGSGSFQAVVLPGGLPGEGWDGKDKILMDGNLQGDTASFVPASGKRKYMASSPKEFSATVTFPPRGHKDYTAVITGGTMRGTTDDSKSFELKKTVRVSPTLGAAAPAGAIVLFDGKSADEWKEGKIQGSLLPVAANSKRTLKDFKLHIEFITPFQPTARSQGRGNSGVYLHGRHEIQVLDSFGLAGLNNECGGFYGNKDPLVNMCYPPLTWQTYDVELKSDPVDPATKKQMAKVMVFHNGIKIHDNVPLPSGQGPLHLQNHGNPVFYRNIWAMELK
jgi:hypothetical protein